MRLKFITMLLVLSIPAVAQTKIERSIKVSQSAKKLVVNFPEPELINLRTWNKQEISVQGKVSINKGENDDAFVIEVDERNGEISITSTLKNEASIPKHVWIMKDDREFFFKTSNPKDPEVRKFLDENGGDFTYMSTGILKEIVLEIFVPEGLETEVKTKFGLVEVKNFNASLSVDAEFGGVDAAIPSSNMGELMARTKFGEILTNLDYKFEGQERFGGDAHWTVISASLGKGPKYEFESKFGKVYLRKQ